MITDYASLQAAVARRAVRSDLTADIPDFIRSAHDRIIMDVVIGADLTLNATSVALPADCRAPVSLWLKNRPWIQVTEASTQQVQASTVQGYGRPTLFAVDGANLTLFPSPEGSWAARLLYRIARDFFTDDASTNVILTRYPNLYLYGAMAELSRQTFDNEAVARWEPLFFGEIERVNAAEIRDVLSGPLQTTSTAP